MEPTDHGKGAGHANDPEDLPATEASEPASEDAGALARLREALIASEPLVAPELVHGGSVLELERTFATAKAAAKRARDMTIASSAPRISSGAPGRTQHTPATPFEKIRTGLQTRI